MLEESQEVLMLNLKLYFGPRLYVDLLEKLGFGGAFNYKEETDLSSTLTRYFLAGIDIYLYFDKVGSERC
ncbi:hypothetical protein RJ639_039223 [Escallonia herrerae]|uniref:Uncharacterized protein n=1 Tax=Escallonia herrerae TaxID=1293975 RepID=A0AA88WLL5_9ASTE|nr:hypothetical protein RJ639_039223 [Escallonia herrerae]